MKETYLKAVIIDNYPRMKSALAASGIPKRIVDHVDWNDLKGIWFVPSEKNRVEVTRRPSDAQKISAKVLLRKIPDTDTLVGAKKLDIYQKKGARTGYILKEAYIGAGIIVTVKDLISLQQTIEAPRRAKNMAKPVNSVTGRKDTVQGIRDWLGFKLINDDEDQQVYFCEESGNVWVVEETDMWSATGEKSGLKYAFTMMEMDADQINDYDEVSHAISDRDITKAAWKKMTLENKCFELLENGQYNEFVGDFDTRLHGWQEIRQRINPHLVFEERVKAIPAKTAAKKSAKRTAGKKAKRHVFYRGCSLRPSGDHFSVCRISPYEQLGTGKTMDEAKTIVDRYIDSHPDLKKAGSAIAKKGTTKESPAREGGAVVYRGFSLRPVADRFDIWRITPSKYIGRDETIAKAKASVDRYIESHPAAKKAGKKAGKKASSTRHEARGFSLLMGGDWNALSGTEKREVFELLQTAYVNPGDLEKDFIVGIVEADAPGATESKLIQTVKDAVKMLPEKYRHVVASITIDE